MIGSSQCDQNWSSGTTNLMRSPWFTLIICPCFRWISKTVICIWSKSWAGPFWSMAARLSKVTGFFTHAAWRALKGWSKKRQQKKRPKFEGFPFWGTNFSQLLDSSYHLIIILFIHLISRISWPFRAFHFCCCDFSSFTSTSTGTCFMASGFFTKMACSDGCPG